MGKAIQVLDHGYVKFIEAMGTGEAKEWIDTRPDFEPGIIEAARMSTQGAFRGWEEDQKLLSYLFNSVPAHAGPFEFAEMIVEIQCPLFVRSEWHRHRTQSYNEMSARYAPLPDLNYVPTIDRIMRNAGHLVKNRQAAGIAGADVLTEEVAREWQTDLAVTYQTLETKYQEALQAGVPKELARTLIPVGRYTRFRAKANLRNWLAFMTLRYDPNAQWEIQQYAMHVGGIINEVFPRTWELYRRQRNERAAMNLMWKEMDPKIRDRYLEKSHEYLEKSHEEGKLI